MAEIQDGAILVARAILNSSLWTMRAEDRLVAITCICIANWRPRPWFDGEQTVVINRGQFVRSWEDLAECCNLSIQSVRTSVEHLEKVGFLTRKPTRRYQVFTIPKYSHYQDLTKYSDEIASEANKTSNSEVTADQQRANSEVTTNNKVIREEGNKKTPEQGAQAQWLAKIWNDGPGLHLNGRKAAEIIQGSLDVGVPYQTVETTFWNHSLIRGKKIWEVLDPLRQKTSHTSSDINPETGNPIGIRKVKHA